MMTKQINVQNLLVVISRKKNFYFVNVKNLTKSFIKYAPKMIDGIRRGFSLDKPLNILNKNREQCNYFEKLYNGLIILEDFSKKLFNFRKNWDNARMAERKFGKNYFENDVNNINNEKYCDTDILNCLNMVQFFFATNVL